MTAIALPILPSLAALRWQVRRLVTGLGLPGMVGMGVLILSAAYGVMALMSLSRELTDLRQTAMQAPQVASIAPVKVEPADQLRALPQTFPRRIELLKWLDRLHQAATDNQLQIDLGDYKLASANPSVQTFQLNFPVRATYAQLRGFLAQALSDNPSLSLDQISFRRQNVNDALLDAQVSMTLFLRAE